MSDGYCQRALMHESEMIRTRMMTQSESEMVAVHGTLFAVPPGKGNNNRVSLRPLIQFLVYLPSEAQN
jgi:hypothetical protein